MLPQTINLATALYYRQRNPPLGFQILIESWNQDRLPMDFQEWWKSNGNFLQQKLGEFIDKGIRFTHPGCWDYPTTFLNNLETSPLFLTYLGSPNWMKTPRLAVVGSRKISTLTNEWLVQELLTYLKTSNVSLLSGGARGVDQCAHLCALRAKRPTHIFLPSGLLRIYPKELNEWVDQVLQGGGTLISEYWPDEEIKKHYFIHRNRLIASMADFILIAQGEVRSGTLLTAQWALDLGRDIGVLPGHPMDSSFAGNLSLLRTGITPILDAKDLENSMSSFNSSL